jgi:ribosomal protein S18
MQEKQVYEIPEVNFDALQTKIEFLNKKAQKLNCQPIIINIVGTIDKKIKHAEKRQLNDLFLMRYYQIIIEGSAPIINNWELIASCEQKENGTLIKVIPDKIYPEKYRSLMICEHCCSERKRKYTFIIRHIISKEYKMVGKSCLKDFLGHVDPNFYANYLQWLDDPDLIEYDDDSRFCKDNYRINTKEYLFFVAACIREKGWISRTKAKESEGILESTSDLALTSLESTYKPIKDKYGNIIEFPKPNENDFTLVDNALIWAKGLTGELNDYLYNINLLAQEESIKYKDLGFVASIISSYQKTLEREIVKQKQQQQKQLSNFVGNIGEKITKELTYVNSYSYETQYGTTWIHKFIDNNNNTYVWKTNNYLNVDQGNNIKIKGTIKDHNEYREEKQTILTRCKVL